MTPPSIHDESVTSSERESLIQFQAIFEHAPIDISLFSTNDYRFLVSNVGRAGRAQSAGPRPDPTGIRVADYVDADTYLRTSEVFERVLATGESVVIEEMPIFLQRDNRLHYFRWTCTPLSLHGPGIDRLLVCSLDVTDAVESRMQIELLAETAQSRLDQLQTVITSMEDAVLITDAASNLIHANPAYQRLLGPARPGETSQERAARTQMRDWSGAHLPAEQSTVRRALRGERYTNGEYIVRTPSGTDLYLLCSGAPLRNGHGEITGAVVVLRDVSALREVERQKDDFLSMVAHELRTPVAAIRGFAQLVGRTLPDTGGATQQRLDVIVRQADGLARLIDELLDFSRVQSGLFQVTRQPLDFMDVVRDVVHETSVLHPSIHVAVDAPPSVPVRGDELRLKQVLQNLIENAIKYGPAGGDITVDLVQRSGDVVTTVSDAGPPLPAEERARIFERFYRADSQLGRGGLGLGLFIVRTIVESHGGKLWVPDRPHSAFSFSLSQTSTA